jgi:hypothetical protein
MYRVLSAATHGTAYALIEGYGPDLDRPNKPFLRPNKDFPWLGSAIALSAASFLRSLERQIYLLGWPTTEFIQTRDHVWAHIGLLVPLEHRTPEIPGWEHAW